MICIVILLLLGGLGLSVYLIAADPKRFLSQFGLYDWKPGRYQSLLSNFLQATQDLRLPAWPRRLNGVSAMWFSFRVRRIVRKGSSFGNSGFLRSHLNLAVLIRMLKPFIDDQILTAQVDLVILRLIDMRDTADRDRLQSFVERATEARRAFQHSLTTIDRQVQNHLRQVHFFPTLQRLHAIFREHGYCLLPQLDALRCWESLDGSELAQELPLLSKPKEIPNWPGLVMNVDDDQAAPDWR
jgi:hypothetical protein